MRLSSAPLRILYGATLAATLAACSKDSLAPLQLSVFYTNLSTHFNNREPGTAIITWLSPETAVLQHTEVVPSGGVFGWWGPGFRTDTVLPNQVRCEHFEAPSDRLAVQYRLSFPGGQGVGYGGRPDSMFWHSESSWGFTGDAVGPAGSASGFGGVIEGC